MNITFMTYEDYNDESIAELELGEAMENTLRRNGVFLIGDVIKHIEENTLAGLKNVGKLKVKEIKNALFNYELSVAPDPIEFLFKCTVNEEVAA